MLTANLLTKILDFRGFDANIILILRGGIPRPVGNLPEVLSQRILVGNLSREIGRNEAMRRRGADPTCSPARSLGLRRGETAPEIDAWDNARRCKVFSPTGLFGLQGTQ